MLEDRPTIYVLLFLAYFSCSAIVLSQPWPELSLASPSGFPCSPSLTTHANRSVLEQWKCSPAIPSSCLCPLRVGEGSSGWRWWPTSGWGVRPRTDRPCSGTCLHGPLTRDNGSHIAMPKYLRLTSPGSIRKMFRVAIQVYLCGFATPPRYIWKSHIDRN